MNRGTLHLAIAACVLVYGASALAQAPVARIVDWVESAPASDNSRIALGYPVPIPVDTPLPFDGFRSYAGLHARHQDLAGTTPWVHPAPIGTTHGGRTIWAYRLGDADLETPGGAPEHAMLTNGGIHAREWQSPEVATGIIELLALAPADHHLVSYLRENANVLVIPVLNVDGFQQTQRYPSTNWLGTDPDDPEFWPRDGRMRRKNMLGADQDLETRSDHLLGVDLNRNNPPYWNTDPQRSSGNTASIVNHGANPHSEPETRALDLAVELGPASKLSMYTDLHSYSQVHFWARNNNTGLARLTEGLLRTFSGFHGSYAAGKYYAFTTAARTPRNEGIGTTDEYFTHRYQVPSWTLEIEPSNGASYHARLPGGGADYGGLGRNEHDGFILPDSEIERVRTELAETFAIAYYRQSGPPSIVAAQLVDLATGAVVFDAEWEHLDAGHRTLHVFQAQPMQLGRDYRLWLAWDKPMRWRSGGEVTVLPGQPTSTLDVLRSMAVDGGTLAATLGAVQWLDQPGVSPGTYRRYRDDAMAYDLRLAADEGNSALLQGGTDVVLSTDVSDFSGNRGDADPSTVARWENGGWSGYEDSSGHDFSDSGGADSTLAVAATADTLGDPFVVGPGISSAWYDPAHDGEGFVLEMLSGNRAVMYWFTYNEAGEQDWYVAVGEVTGNRAAFPQLLQVSGGVFGPEFDPENVIRTVAGSASFTWSSCDTGIMRWTIDGKDATRRRGHMNLTRLSRLLGLGCGDSPQAADPAAGLSGSWYDPTHSGEGYVLEVLDDGRALVYWFSFDGEGNRRWFFGTAAVTGGGLRFDDLLTTRGGIFGPAFDPEAVEVKPWGSLELDLACSGGAAEFTSSEPGFPAGRLDLVRLTQLDTLVCQE